MTCNCIGDIEKQQAINDYAENIAREFHETCGDLCPEMITYAVEQTIARLLHIDVFSADPIRFDPLVRGCDTATVEAVAKKLYEMSRTLPAVLQVIMKEQRVLMGDKNESN